MFCSSQKKHQRADRCRPIFISETWILKLLAVGLPSLMSNCLEN